MYLDFKIFIRPEECMEHIKRFQAIFDKCPMLSGIIFFGDTKEINGKQLYEYLFIKSPNSSIDWWLPENTLQQVLI